MTESKALHILQEAKFIVIDEDSNATYADHLVTGYMQTLKKKFSIQPPLYLYLFISPDCFYSRLLEIIGKSNIKIHDYFTPDIYDLSTNYKINLDAILIDTDINDKSIVVINCLSSLILTVGLAKAVSFVEKLASRVGQLICIFNRDICAHKFPSIETLGTTYVQLNRCEATVLNNDIVYELSITHRKLGGGIWKKTLMAIQDIGTFEIKFEKLQIGVPKLNVSVSEPTIQPQATFRTEMNPREVEQRNKTPLPYTVNANIPNESKIIYIPDDMDDLDEEDPDDDLPF